MAPPLVSVLIPAYNAGPWIAGTIQSALAQTWPRLEIIIVDGGSSDGTHAIASSFASAAVQVVRQEGRLSASANRNRAARLAQGEFLQFLDADDLLSADKVQRQVARLQEEPGCVASCEWARFHDAPDEGIFIAEDVWRDMAPDEWLIAAWRGGGGMMQPGLWLVPRAVAERAGPWNEDLTLIDDFEYFTRVVLASGGVRFCAGARLYYRSGNPQSLASRRSPAAWQSALRALELGTAALLARTTSVAAREACAAQFQVLAYDAHLQDRGVTDAAEAHARRLGGASVPMGGGAVFGALRSTLGWKRAKALKQLVYRLGYAPRGRASGSRQR